MAIPVSSPAQNRVGPSNQFTPLPSAGGVSADRLSFSEAFASHAPPGVLANEAPLAVDVNRFSPFFGNALLTPVLQLTSQVPEPCALVLSAWIAENDRWRDVVRLPARAIKDPTAVWTPWEGRFAIEWGVGKTRNYLFTDFAPGSIQIPIASFVRVWAHAWNESVPLGSPPVFIAGAAGYLGQQHPAPDANYTVELCKRIGDPAADIAVTEIMPPYVREVSGGVHDAAIPAAAVASIIMSDLFNGVGLSSFSMAAPNLVAPFAATNPTLPHELRRVPVPAGLILTTLALRGAPGAANAGAHFSFGVRV